MAASTTLCIILFVFLNFASISLQRDVAFRSFLSSDLNSPRSQAEQLIRALNLFPNDEVNHYAANDLDVGSSRIVEKRFMFPSLANEGTSVEDLGHHAGYFRLPRSIDARMFYFFFESRAKNGSHPVVIWLTGGPGCGSELAMFYENGPFYLMKNLTLLWNDFGWDQVSNILFVDQPIGTGFSYTSNNKDPLREDEVGVSNDLYDFLQEFFKAHPIFVKNDFYITGESYAGHYIPALASRIFQGNKNNKNIPINLKGFAIGNGLTNPIIQYKAYPDFALDAKLIKKSDYNSLKPLVSKCEKAIKPCGHDNLPACRVAFATCSPIFGNIREIIGGVNYYDIRKRCVGNMCYDFSNVEVFLNQDTVKKALNVGQTRYVSCSRAVYEAMVGDWMQNLAVGIPSLLENRIKVLIYAGEYDLICNWLGNSRWVDAMKWSGQKRYLAASMKPFTVDGKKAGLQKGYGPLTFLKVHDAGHMVPMDQPKASLEMIRRWMQGQPL